MGAAGGEISPGQIRDYRTNGDPCERLLEIGEQAGQSRCCRWSKRMFLASDQIGPVKKAEVDAGIADIDS